MVSRDEEIQNQINELQDNIKNISGSFDASLHKLITQINKAFSCTSADISKEMNELALYNSKRMDDIDRKLHKIELDMDIVRKELSDVSNWTKTGDKIFELTRTHAYEIPKIEVRLTNLENDNIDKDTTV